MPSLTHMHHNLIKEARRRLMLESVPRITQCLVMLSEEDIWMRPNKESNSIGNLVLHLCGNVRQYVLSGIDGQKDDRERNKEFSEKERIDKEELIEKMNSLMIEVDDALDRIKMEDWTQMKKVQGFDESILSILIHVIEHFSYHTGQIAFYTKLLTAKDLKFYGDLDLDITS
jgi:uncharacterized damage-inducible protein DinB